MLGDCNTLDVCQSESVRWKYATLILESREGTWTAAGSNEPIRNIDDLLNNWGWEGWELVTVNHSSDPGVRPARWYTFRRAIQ
ncbi:MAG: hypothetical protein QOI95_817 [Acidimicrobiaceae bacterium]|jgi:hypothetical protein